MTYNTQSPPVSLDHILRAGLIAVMEGNEWVVITNKRKRVKFNDIEWGHGASGMLFVNHYPITDYPVPATKEGY